MEKRQHAAPALCPCPACLRVILSLDVAPDLGQEDMVRNYLRSKSNIAPNSPHMGFNFLQECESVPSKSFDMEVRIERA